jgi:N-methylhydantoinase B
VSGDLCGTSFPNAIGGWDDSRGREYVYYEAPAGGNGAFRDGDGSNAWGNIDFGNVRTIQTAESLEHGMPLLVMRSELRRDSGGEGRQRGGLGMRRELKLLSGEARYSVLGDRAVIPPFGAAGAGHAAPVRVSLLRDGREMEFDTPGKVTGYPIHAGDVVVMQSAGGGGFGDPLDREPERVLRDLVAGHVSAERARDGYGVVLAADGTVDEPATAVCRAALRAARRKVLSGADERDPYEGGRGRHRVLRLSPALMRSLGLEAGDLVELRGRHPAPLRAWARADTDAPAAEIGLDAFGRRVLGIAAGDPVEVRRLPMPAVPGGLADGPGWR